MAEYAQLSLEKFLPVFNALKESKLLTPEQRNEFIKRCTRYEYRTLKKTKKQEDFYEYIRYLKDFLKYWNQLLLDEKRTAPRNVVYNGVTKKIAGLYKARSNRFKKIEYYLDEARFCKKHERLHDRASAAYTRLLQIHSTIPELYVEAAKFEASINHNADNARTLLQLAIRKFPEDLSLWVTFVKTELDYVRYIRERQEKLTDADKSGRLVSLSDEANDAVLNLQLVEIVIAEALEKIPEPAAEEFRSKCAALSENYSFATDKVRQYLDTGKIDAC